jgi:thioredoxin-like negative regulator of GroEL
MSERVALAGAILAGIALAGYLVKWLRAHQMAGVMSGQTIDVALAGAPSVIAFSGPGCAACVTQRRILDAVVADWNGPVEVAYVDVVAEHELARRFGVMVVPTTVVAAPDGRIVGINGGLADADRLRAQLNEWQVVRGKLS